MNPEEKDRAGQEIKADIHTEMHARIKEQVRRDVLKEIENETRRFGRTAFTSLGTYMGAAFGFVIGLAWNNAVQALINAYFPNKNNSVPIQFGYAAVLTLVVVAGTFIVTRIVRHDDKKDGTKK